MGGDILPPFTFDVNFYCCPRAGKLSARKIGREQTFLFGFLRIPPEEAGERKLPVPAMEEPQYIFRSATILPLGRELAGIIDDSPK